MYRNHIAVYPVFHALCSAVLVIGVQQDVTRKVAVLAGQIFSHGSPGQGLPAIAAWQVDDLLMAEPAEGLETVVVIGGAVDLKLTFDLLANLTG